MYLNHNERWDPPPCYYCKNIVNVLLLLSALKQFIYSNKLLMASLIAETHKIGKTSHLVFFVLNSNSKKKIVDTAEENADNSPLNISVFLIVFVVHRLRRPTRLRSMCGATPFPGPSCSTRGWSWSWRSRWPPSSWWRSTCAWTQHR